MFSIHSGVRKVIKITDRSLQSTFYVNQAHLNAKYVHQNKYIKDDLISFSFDVKKR